MIKRRALGKVYAPGSSGLPRFRRPVNSIARSSWVMAVLLSTLAVPAIQAQRRAPAWLDASAGLGGSGGGGNVFQGSPNYTVHVGGGISLTGRLGVDASFDLVRGWGRGDRACAADVACPGYFDLTGGTVGLIFNAGPRGRSDVRRLSVGVGWFDVSNDFEPANAANSAGIRVGLDQLLVTSNTIGLSIGVRALVLPGVRDELLWVLPLVLSGRLYLGK